MALSWLIRRLLALDSLALLALKLAVVCASPMSPAIPPRLPLAPFRAAELLLCRDLVAEAIRIKFRVQRAALWWVNGSILDAGFMGGTNEDDEDEAADSEGPSLDLKWISEALRLRILVCRSSSIRRMVFSLATRRRWLESDRRERDWRQIRCMSSM